jgi:hypothetical protein
VTLVSFCRYISRQRIVLARKRSFVALISLCGSILTPEYRAGALAPHGFTHAIEELWRSLFNRPRRYGHPGDRSKSAHVDRRRRLHRSMALL